LIVAQRQSALLLSDNQKAATTKILAKLDHRHDHHFATGRHFTLRLPPPFSSRLSRNMGGSRGATILARARHCDSVGFVRRRGKSLVAIFAHSLGVGAQILQGRLVLRFGQFASFVFLARLGAAARACSSNARIASVTVGIGVWCRRHSSMSSSIF